MTTATEVAVFHAAGSGRMLITTEHGCWTFSITGRTNSLTISDDEAGALAETILGRT